MTAPERRRSRAWIVLAAAFVAGCGGEPPPLRITHGPWPAEIGETEIAVWLRASRAGAGTVTLEEAREAGTLPVSQMVVFREEEDGCRTVRFRDLAPDRAYRVRANLADGAAAPVLEFRTAPPADHAGRVRFAVGSCAREDAGKPNAVFPAIAARRPDLLLLIGDTPYIDSVRLDHQFRRYREFFSDPGLLALRRTTPLHAVWDDHDFGRNDADGRLAGKEQARRAFLAWHAEGTYGLDGEGVCSRFRRGPVEVFLLDARWWSRTAPSPDDPTKPTLLGAKQRAWLEAGLLASTAPFKLLVTGMVWNDAVRPKKTDYWGAYPHERAGLFRFLTARRISGVVLVAGDVHRSRHFIHPPTTTGVPYPLHEIVASPLGANIHKDAEVGSPALRFDRGEPRSFVELDALLAPDGGAELIARWRNAAGDVLHEAKMNAADLR
jgi:alkaline phosphatase D